MSHLGDRLSALVDGELGHDERDRLYVHLAACQECRAEAAALRALKRRVGALGDPDMDATLLGRLLAFAEPGEPVPKRRRPAGRSGRPRPAWLMYPDTQMPAGRPRGSRRPANRRLDGAPAEGGPAKGGPAERGLAEGGPAERGLAEGGPAERGLERGPAEGSRAPHRRVRPVGRRSHYVIACVASFLVVGVGGLSFVVGGGQGAPGPRITPPVEMFTVEHSVTTGELPFANPAATFLPAPVAPRGGP
jgi:Putative zinc-finger